VAAGLGVRRSGLAAVAADLEPGGRSGRRRIGRVDRARGDARADVPADATGDDPSWALEEPPLWFREGMASVTAGQGHRRPPALDLSRWAAEHPGDDLLRPAPELYRTEKDAVYGAAHRTFELLVKTAGDDAVRQLLRRVSAGWAFFRRVQGLHRTRPGGVRARGRPGAGSIPRRCGSQGRAAPEACSPAVLGSARRGHRRCAQGEGRTGGRPVSFRVRCRLDLAHQHGGRDRAHRDVSALRAAVAVETRAAGRRWR